MRHFRTITSLVEDMQALGLAPVSESRPMPKVPPKTAANPKPKALKESRQKPAARASAQQRRQQRLERKACLMSAALEKLAEQRKAGAVRPQLRFKTGLKSRASMLESIDLRAMASRSVKKSEVIRAFEQVSAVAGLLARKFSVLEDLMDLPVMHPGSEYGYAQDGDNIRPGNKTGDAIDYVGAKDEDDEGLKPGDEVEEEESDNQDDMHEEEDGDDDADDAMKEEDDDEKDGDDEMHEEDGDDDADDADDKMHEEDGDDEKKDDDKVSEEEDDEKAKEDEKMAESARRRAQARMEHMPMAFELNAIRLEAENMAAQISVGDTIGPRMAVGILGDMSSYLAGAMKMYQDLANKMTKVYAGQGVPEGVGVPPESSKDNPETYIGMKGPEGETAVDEGGLEGAQPGKIDTASAAEPAAESKQKPKAKPKTEGKVKPKMVPPPKK